MSLLSGLLFVMIPAGAWAAPAARSLARTAASGLPFTRVVPAASFGHLQVSGGLLSYPGPLASVSLAATPAVLAAPVPEAPPVVLPQGPIVAAHVAMAWVVVLKDALPLLAPSGPLAAFRQIDLMDPVQVRVLTPLISALDAQGLVPADFVRFDVDRRREVLSAAFARAANQLGARAVRLALDGGGAGRADDEVLAGKVSQADEILSLAPYLSPGQLDLLRRARGDAAGELAARRESRAMESAAETARRLADQEPPAQAVSDPVAAEGMPFDPAAWKIVRGVARPDGRRAWFVQQGPIYRLYFEGDPRPAAEFDVRRWDEDGIPVYNVERGGRRGIYFEGRVLWEPLPAA